MKSKLGILSALVLSLAVAGSAFASSGTPQTGKSSMASKTSKPKKHHRMKKAKSAKKTGNTMATPPQK